MFVHPGSILATVQYPPVSITASIISNHTTFRINSKLLNRFGRWALNSERAFLFSIFFQTTITANCSFILKRGKMKYNGIHIIIKSDVFLLWWPVALESKRVLRNERCLLSAERTEKRRKATFLFFNHHSINWSEIKSVDYKTSDGC